MFFTQKKLNQRVEELDQYQLHSCVPVENLLICYDREGENGSPPPSEGADWICAKQGMEWQEKDIYVWLKTSYTFPQIVDKTTTHVGIFNFSLGSLREDFEALLYVDNHPWHGLDKNHNIISFPNSFSGKTITFHIRIWSGVLEGKVRQHFEAFHVGNSLKTVAFAQRDNATHDLYITSLAILQTVNVLSNNDPYYTQLLNQLDDAYQLIDWQNTGSEAFYQSINNANDFLNQHYSQDARKPPITINCVGHTHIDLAFLWQIKHTREKCARSFSTVLKLMEQFPEYNFFQSQPQLYDYLKSDYPEIYQQIKQRIAEGRWEVDGAMWVEADCNIPSGESFVRQIIYGTAFMQKEFGITPECLWLPDVFGYSWALPQILKKSGIKYFMTTKISWNEFNQLPHDTFKWKGIDGSEILAHFVTTPEEGYPRYTYNGMVNAESVQGLWDNYKDKGLTKTLLLPFGYGDGGGGPNEKMIELLQRFQKMPGLPDIEFGHVNQFFHQLENDIKQSTAWYHTWDGELYFETHRGTYTSQAQVKNANRRAEIDIRFIEWLSAVNALTTKDWQQYPKEVLDDCWKLILRNQFHDIIPGSSIAEVYQDAEQEYQSLNTQYAQLKANLYKHLIDNNTAYSTILNSSSWARKSDVIYLSDLDDNHTMTDSSNQPLITQKSRQHNGTFVALPAIEASSCITIQQDKIAPIVSVTTSPFVFTDNILETPFYIISWNQFGHLSRIYDKQNQREVLSDVGNVLTVYEDKPMKYDAWDIEIFHIQKQKPVTELISVELTEMGPLVAEVTFNWTFNHSQICQRMRVYHASRRIDFITDINWQDYNQLLKTVFPVSIRAVEATYDIQFGNVKRSTTWNTSWDYAKFESVAHQWVDLSEYGYGVSLLNNCKYGHSVKENIMQLTLIKSAISPDAHADRRQHQFTYSLFPHQDGWQEANTVQEAWFLNEPLRIVQGKATQNMQSKLSLIKLNNPFIQLDAVKKAENGDWLIVRIHDFSGGQQSVTLSSNYHIEWWQECDLLENFTNERHQTNQITMTLSPYEIRTIAISLK